MYITLRPLQSPLTGTSHTRLPPELPPADHEVQLQQLENRKNMKPVPLLLLLSSVLLSSHLRPAAGRPRILPGWLDGSGRLHTHQLDNVLLRAAAAGEATASDLLDGGGSSSSIPRFLRDRNPEHLPLLPEEESEVEAVRAAAQLLKRSEDPPLSIDLTFHLLRNMIQMAKMESQREQAQLNRRVLDEVGK